jgi:OmpA-OmpF porin, OOP family
LNLVMKFKLSPKANFFLGGGPYLSFFYNGSEKTETFFKNGTFSSDENNDLPIGKGAGKYEVVNYGVNGTAGFEFGKVFISGKYAAGLNDFYQASSYDGSFKHQVISATIGVYLGKPVKLESKIKDRDNDGVPDDLDLCPDEPGTALTNGCPDRDSDGTADKDDACPDIAGLVKNKGCPEVKDSDGDGVPDNEDKCPNLAGLKKYAGCPVPDSDGDGVNDEEDKCPTIAGFGRYGGCPIPDSDGDGINDEEDKCPTVAGKKENNGCPEGVIQKEIIEKVNWAASKIQFKFGSTIIESSGLSKLDEVVAILKKDPELKLSIEGHTSSDGNYEANMKLSLERANSVRNYLILKGVSIERIKTTGYGPDRPLFKEKSQEANLANRRVELKLSN